MKRIVLGVLVVVVLVAVVATAMRPQSIPVETAEIVLGPLTVTLDEEGRTRVRERYEVLAPLDGLLHRIDLEPGDEVQGGVTVVATVEPLASTLLDERTIATASARVTAAHAALDRAREMHETAGRLLRVAEDDLDRQRKAGSSVSRQAIADAEREVLFREGERDATEAAVRVAVADLAVAEAALLVAQPAASDGPDGGERPAAGGGLLVVEAPVDGRVLRVLRKSEGPVRIGESLVELGDTSHLEIVADYLTTEAVRIEPGMEAIVEDWGRTESVAARVRRVEPGARTKVSSLGVEEQRVDVLLDLVDPPEAAASLADGFRVQVRVVVWRGDDLVLVPEAALVRREEGWSVFRVVGNTAEEVPIEIDHRDGRSAEATAGIEVGDRVVLYPSDRLANGVRVAER
ncbi:MAG: HlyD family efflux transporter periplasmic adaptor subunit [Planctomycetota bacterium]